MLARLISSRVATCAALNTSGLPPLNAGSLPAWLQTSSELPVLASLVADGQRAPLPQQTPPLYARVCSAFRLLGEAPHHTLVTISKELETPEIPVTPEKQKAEADKKQAEADKKQAEARLEQAEARIEQAEADKKQAEARIEQAQADKKQAEARLERAEARLEQAEADKKQAQAEYEQFLSNTDNLRKEYGSDFEIHRRAAENKLLEAITAHGKATDAYREALAAHREALAAYGKDTDAHREAIAAHTKATEFYHRLIAQGPRQIEFVPLEFDETEKSLLLREFGEWKACEVITIPGVSKAFNMWGESNDIFVRGEMVNALNAWETHRPYAMVIGSPGIGKTQMTRIAAFRSLLQGDPVVLMFKDSKKLVTMVDGGLEVENLQEVPEQLGKDGRPSGEDVVVIYDSPKGFQENVTQSARVFKRVLVVHSPSGHRSNTAKANIEYCFVGRPTLEEMLTFGQHLGLPKDQVLERMRQFGNNFRYLSYSLEGAERDINDALDKFSPTVDGLETVLGKTGEVHRLFALEQKNGGSTYTFASPVIRDKIIDKLASKEKRHLLQYVNTVDIHGSLRGEILENRMIDAFGHENNQLEVIRAVDDGNTVDQRMQVNIGGDYCVFDVNSFVDDAQNYQGRHLSSNILYVPLSANNATWDAFICLDHVVYFLSITVAKSHDVKKTGLKNALAIVKHCTFEGATANDKRFVWLLAPVVYERFKLPTGVNNDNRKLLQEFIQEKWCLDVLNNETYWP